MSDNSITPQELDKFAEWFLDDDEILNIIEFDGEKELTEAIDNTFGHYFDQPIGEYAAYVMITVKKISEPLYCLEPHDTPTIATHQHPEVSRKHPLCETHYNEVVKFEAEKFNELAKAYDRSFERP
jgi:hypothetical protein